ncbi:hypothetical protein JAAARDRAFT_33027 [Jaapia argillacea MUCL 33604]|uniref:Uncharacterized protein n=1 Tax=Jaapia argillacea MUCL 33604 TaxID=933084 RepID=A0A067Q7K2_9AGAM|nr:hypothetical protein JAAARDRAFT_33027 [Jaapia argillacea MUCL 33604]
MDRERKPVRGCVGPFLDAPPSSPSLCSSSKLCPNVRSRDDESPDEIGTVSANHCSSFLVGNAGVVQTRRKTLRGDVKSGDDTSDGGIGTAIECFWRLRCDFRRVWLGGNSLWGDNEGICEGVVAVVKGMIEMNKGNRTRVMCGSVRGGFGEAPHICSDHFKCSLGRERIGPEPTLSLFADPDVSTETASV